MTTIEKIAPVATHLGQGTAIEQSRAMAQVEAAVLIAQRFPRNQQAAIAAMRESCRFEELANRAFYSYRRGGSNVTGPSVYLARELARIWGNIDYGVHELLRNDKGGQSEMLAVAWDLQTNTRVSAIFVVPHTRDKDGTTVPLTQSRDIYENNANQGAKRVRQSIYSVLPPWFVAEAEKLCRETIEHGGGVPLAQRVADVIRDYDEYFHVDVDRLERQVGRPSEKWTASDVAQLRITGGSLKNGEITADEAFPPVRATAAEVTGASTPAPAQPVQQATPNASTPTPTAPERPADQTAEPESAPTPAAQLRAAKAGEVAERRAVHAAEDAAPIEEPPTAAPVDDVPPPDEPPAEEEKRDNRPAARTQIDALMSRLSETFGITAREDVLDTVSKLVGQRLASSKDLTRYEATTLLRYLEELAQQPEPARVLDQVLIEREPPKPDEGA